MFVIIFGGLPIMNVINFAMNIIKHLFSIVIHKNCSKRNSCVNWLNLGQLALTICRHRCRQLADTGSLLLFFSNMVYNNKFISSCLTHYGDYLVIVIWTITKHNVICKKLVSHVKLSWVCTLFTQLLSTSNSHYGQP